MKMTHSLYPCLWFDGQAMAAANFYCTVFPNSKIISTNPIVVMFELNGSRWMALNGGPKFKFTEAVSFVINCNTQEEIDYYWNKLVEGGEESQCGWLRDRFGVSWQVVPSMLGDWMNNPATGPKVMEAFLKMRKFDIEMLKRVAQL